MIALADAQRRILDAVAPLAAERRPLRDALGRVLAEAIVSSEPVPPFDNTAMDGFAVRAGDTSGATVDAPVLLPVAATVAAGDDATRVEVPPGTAARIMTGAPMPPGVDAVVMVERTRIAPTVGQAGGERVAIEVEAAPGDHVRRAGDDIRPGQEVFGPGTTLHPGHLGVLASIGIETVTVIRRPVVGVLSTGDELVDGAAPLRPGQIRDANRMSLLGLVAQAGFEAVDLGIVGDDEEQVEDAIGGPGVDAVITTGGVSMGDFDYVKVVLQRRAPDTARWMQVAIRPAKPLSFAVLDGVVVFGLPGNPVSCMVSFELFARPALRRMAGFADGDLHRPRVRATAADDLKRGPDGKIHFARVTVAYDGTAGTYVAQSRAGQGSHMLRTMALANALAVLPDGDGVRAGDPVDVILLT